MSKSKSVSLLPFFPLILLPILIVISWLLVNANISYILVFVCGLVILSVVALLWLGRDLHSDEKWILILVVAGFLLKLAYVLYTPITIRQHDVGSFFQDEDGHSAYIRYFFNFGKLPDFDPREVFQFYHPPLHHILAALWARLNLKLGLPLESCWENIQLLTLLYTSLCQLIMARILTTLRFHGKGLIIPLAVFCFHPYLIFLSGSINNDPLSILFMMLIILYTLRYIQAPNYKNITILALCYGLGMSTKLSVAYLAPATAAVFLWKVWHEKGSFKKYLCQWIVFAVIAFPLGLWFYVRNLLRFGVPITYVPLLSSTSYQYIGDYSIAQRLFDFSKVQFDNLFISFKTTNGYLEHNILLAILKTAVFEEQTLTGYYSGVLPASTALFYVNIPLILCSLVGMICGLRRLKSQESLFLGLVYIVIMGFFISFCFTYPHVCTMNYRYIFPTLICGVIGLAVLTEKKYSLPVVVLSLLFCLCSVAQFILLGL